MGLFKKKSWYYYTFCDMYVYTCVHAVFMNGWLYEWKNLYRMLVGLIHHENQEFKKVNEKIKQKPVVNRLSATGRNNLRPYNHGQGLKLKLQFSNFWFSTFTTDKNGDEERVGCPWSQLLLIRVNNML